MSNCLRVYFFYLIKLTKLDSKIAEALVSCALGKPEWEKETYTCVCIGWTKCNVSQPQNVTQHSLKKKERKKIGGRHYRSKTGLCASVYVCVCVVKGKMITANQQFIIIATKITLQSATLHVSPRTGKGGKKRPTRDRFPVPQYIEPSVH